VAVKGALTFVLALAIGAGAFWVFQTVSSRVSRNSAAQQSAPSPPTTSSPDAPPAAGPEEAEADAAEDATPPGRAETRPTVVKRPLFSPPGAAGSAPAAEAEQPATAPRLATAPSAEAPAGTPVPEVVTRAPPAAKLATPSGTDDPAAKPRPATAFETERGLARAAFEAGDTQRGLRIVEQVYAGAKDRPDVDLTPEVERLLEVETKLERKREYVQYLVRLDRTGRVLDDLLARVAHRLPAAEESPEIAYAAWDDLTLAHDAAPNATGRKRVMSVAQPFLQRMIFSGRYSPLVKGYMIQKGDSLTSIALKFETTSDSIRRINNLKSDVIQPRQRLRILPGKLRIAVDKSDFLLTATLDGRILFEFSVGTGRDNATPIGTFLIRVRQRDPSWWRPGEGAIPAGDSRNILGSRWLGFQETQDFAGFGIHGTSDPSSIGKESSAGCIRLRNEDIELLYDFVPYGTEVVIRA